MNAENALLALAEIGAGFAGFAALVTILGNRDLGKERGPAVLRLRLVVALAQAALYFLLLLDALFRDELR
jgi:hypothetical protein